MRCVLFGPSVHITSLSQHSYNTFEYYDLLLTKPTKVRNELIYHPPSTQMTPCESEEDFLSEIDHLLHELSSYPGKLVVMGDFNIHVDSPNADGVSQFLDIMQSHRLTQHVQGPFHVKGHTLDLVLSGCDDTDLLKQTSHAHLPILIEIVHRSRLSGNFPHSLKHGVLKPLLKEPDLDLNKLSTYRPVTNLKLLERVAVKQLIMHLQENGMQEMFQHKN